MEAQSGRLAESSRAELPEISAGLDRVAGIPVLSARARMVVLYAARLTRGILWGPVRLASGKTGCRAAG